MSFFKSKAKTNQKEAIKLYYTKEKTSWCVVAIAPEWTCQDILKNNWDEMSKGMAQCHKTEECLFSVLFQDNGESTYLILQPNNKPYNEIKTKGLEVYYMPKSIHSIKREKERTKSNELASIYQSPQPNKSPIIEGQLQLYLPASNTFFKIRLTLTESLFTLIQQANHIDFPIDSNFKVSRDLEYASQEIREKIKDKDNAFQIVSNQNNLIFKAKSLAEYDSWMNSFDIAIHSGEEKRREQNYDLLLEKHIHSIGINCNNRVELSFDCQFFFSRSKARRYMFAFFNSKKLYEIFENIILYRNSATSEKIIESWAYLLQVLGYIENFVIASEDKPSKLPKFIEAERLAEFKAVKKQIEAIMISDSGVSSAEISQQAKAKISELMKVELFDEEYNNIVENILKPFYERQAMKDYLMKGIYFILFVDCLIMHKFKLKNKYIHFSNDLKRLKEKEKEKEKENEKQTEEK